MDDCCEIRDRLDDWLDGVLKPSQYEGIEAHLRSCADCREFFQRHEALAEDLFTLGGAADQIASAPAKTEIAKPKWSYLLRIAAAILLAVTVGIASTQYWSGRQREVLVQDISVPKEMSGGLQQEKFHLDLSDNRMVVRMKSGDPLMHIVWLYETVQLPFSPDDKDDDSSVSPSSF